MKYNLKNAPNWAPAIWVHLENMKAELRKLKGDPLLDVNKMTSALVKEILGE